jgi:hypothetical protein
MVRDRNRITARDSCFIDFAERGRSQKIQGNIIHRIKPISLCVSNLMPDSSDKERDVSLSVHYVTNSIIVEHKNKKADRNIFSILYFTNPLKNIL